MNASPLPDVEHPLTREFWAGAARGELVIPRCPACEAFVWYPQDVCPACRAGALPWVAVSGRATLFSWCRVDRPLYSAFAGLTPYWTGIVALEEDPRVRIVTRLVDCAEEDLRMDMPMRVDFREMRFPNTAASVIAPFFGPAT